MEVRSMLLALLSPPLLQNTSLGQKTADFVSYRFPLGKVCSKLHGKVTIMLRLLLRRRHECDESDRRCFSFLASSAKIPPAAQLRYKADQSNLCVCMHVCVCVARAARSGLARRLCLFNHS